MIKSYYKCMCGYKCNINNIHSHLSSIEHDKKMLDKYAPTTNHLISLMDRLDNIKEHMNNNIYLNKCKKLKDIFNYWNVERDFKRIWIYNINNDKIIIQYYDHLNNKFEYKRNINN